MYAYLKLCRYRNVKCSVHPIDIFLVTVQSMPQPMLSACLDLCQGVCVAGSWCVSYTASFTLCQLLPCVFLSLTPHTLSAAHTVLVHRFQLLIVITMIDLWRVYPEQFD